MYLIGLPKWTSKCTEVVLYGYAAGSGPPYVPKWPCTELVLPHCGITALCVASRGKTDFVTLSRWTDFFLFNKYEKKLFLNFDCWILPENFSVCPKNRPNGFIQLRGMESGVPNRRGFYA